ncbi:MAG TPA: hypothetical protein VGQ55_00515 [Pyrinomonadaceae bacterium]|nr:hypothetical protein [Pyrinomonadaceae bacterium]
MTEEIAKGLFVALFFYVFGRGADGLLFAAVCAQVTAVLIFAPRTLSAYREFSFAKVEGAEPIWKFLRDHRKWAIASSYIGTLGLSLRLWLIKLFLGTETVGLFSFAYGILGHLSSFLPLSSVLASLTPRYRDRPADFARLIRGSLKLQLWIAGVIVVGALIFTPVLTHVVFPKYESALTVTLLVILALLPSTMNATLTPAFSALREQRTLFVNQIIRIVSTILFAGPLMLALGLFGVGIELFVTLTICALERMWRLHRLVPEFSFSARDLGRIQSDERQFIITILQQIRFRWLARLLFGENSERNSTIEV